MSTYHLQLRMKKWSLLYFLLFMLIGGLSTAASSFAYDLLDYYPLTVGSHWHIGDERDEIQPHEQVNGHEAVKMVYDWGDGKDHYVVYYDNEYLYITEYYLYNWDDGMAPGTYSFVPPRKIKRHLNVGETFSNSCRLYFPNGSSVPFNTTYTLSGIENINTPAGYFADCLRILENVNGDNQTNWWAPGVGQVKYCDEDGCSRLTSYYIPEQQSNPTPPSGNLSASDFQIAPRSDFNGSYQINPAVNVMFSGTVDNSGGTDGRDCQNIVYSYDFQNFENRSVEVPFKRSAKGALSIYVESSTGALIQLHTNSDDYPGNIFKVCNGQGKCSYSCGSYAEGWLGSPYDIGTVLNDNQWHTLKITKESDRVIFSVDNGTYRKEVTTAYGCNGNTSVSNLDFSGAVTLKIIPSSCRWKSGTLDYAIGNVVLGSTDTPSDDIHSGLVVHYPFNGNTNDMSGNLLNSELHGNASVSSDELFIGNNSNSYLSIPDQVIQGANDFSVTFEFRLNETENRELNTFLSTTGSNGREGFTIFYDQRQKSGVPGLYVVRSYFSLKYPIMIEPGIKYSFALIRKGGDMTIYIDGQNLGTFSWGEEAINIYPGTFLLGQEQDSPAGGFQSQQALAGSIDDFRVYNRVLSESEIHELYNSSPNSNDCNASNLSACLNSLDCSNAGGAWTRDGCVNSQFCGPDNLSLCYSAADCSSAGGYWYNETCNASPQPAPSPGSHTAAPSEALGVVNFPASVTPSNNQVQVGNCNDVMIQPTLAIPSSDVGKTATLIMYLYLPGMNFGINIPSKTKVLTSETKFDLLSNAIDFSTSAGLNVYIYYGYILGGDIKYNAYSIVVGSSCSNQVTDCGSITDYSSCSLNVNCEWEAFPTARCFLKCSQFTDEAACNAGFNGGCRWNSMFGACAPK